MEIIRVTPFNSDQKTNNPLRDILLVVQRFSEAITEQGECLTRITKDFQKLSLVVGENWYLHQHAIILQEDPNLYLEASYLHLNLLEYVAIMQVAAKVTVQLSTLLLHIVRDIGLKTNCRIQMLSQTWSMVTYLKATP